MNFPEKLRQARLTKGKKQKEVAEYLGVTTSTYCGYETGKRQPDMHKLKRISEFLDVSISDLLWQGDGVAKAPLHGIATPNGAHIVSDPKLKEPSISDEDIKFAFFGGADEITDEMLDEVRRFAEFVRQREEAKKKPPQD